MIFTAGFGVVGQKRTSIFSLFVHGLCGIVGMNEYMVRKVSKKTIVGWVERFPTDFKLTKIVTNALLVCRPLATIRRWFTLMEILYVF